ncbi:MAG: hypothetical protein JO222_11190, partial [Frankiales bacterium]|nr:hypothetical protein [Frankiales bacterium]
MRTSVRLVIATAAAATAATGGLAAPAGAGTPAVGSAGGHLASVVHAGTRFAATQSSNWFGYSRGMLDKKKRFTSIEGTWVVPTAHQHTRGDSGEASATWIGIGGGCLDSGCGTGTQDETLIQAGTEQDVAANGTASYNAWWEIIPEPETRIALPVRPGDTV